MSRTRYSTSEVSVGVFMLLGISALLYLSISLGGMRLFADERYALSARFASVGGLKVGDPVRVAGVLVGEVESISLDNFQALTVLRVDRGVLLPTDTIASVQSAGLLGDNFISLTPGAEDKNLDDGGRIVRTESAVSLTELLGKYAFGSPVGDEGDKQEPKSPAEPAPSSTAPEFDDPLK
jgi:phospholipid/cholesterol/gamma-HCH transport system substrate-binding protein